MPVNATGESNRMFEQAMEMFESALQTGVKIQEESTRRLSAMLTQWGQPQDWQKKTQAAFNETLSAAQKNVEEALRVMSDSARRNLDLLQRFFNGGPAESPSDVQDQARDFWEATMTAMRSNAQAVVQANTRVLESWAELGRRFNGAAVNSVES